MNTKTPGFSLLSTLLLFVFSSSVSAQTYTSTENGNFSDCATWGYPPDIIQTITTGDPVNFNIADGDTVAVPDNTTAHADLVTFEAPAGILNLGGTNALLDLMNDGTDISCTVNTYIKASNTGGDDEFGYVVSLSADGRYLAVGAPREDDLGAGINPVGVQNKDDGDNTGAVYVFVRVDSTWQQQAYIKVAQGTQNNEDQFGISLSIDDDGNTLVVGAFDNSDSRGPFDESTTTAPSNNGALSSGAAYVFTRTGTTWTRRTKIKSFNSEAGDQFGGSVAISDDGTTIAVGARFDGSAARGVDDTSINIDNNDSDGSGAVYVFRRDITDDTWTQEAYIKDDIRSLNDEDWFGHALDLDGDGNTLVVGVPREDSNDRGIFTATSPPSHDNTAGNTGAVYVFIRTETSTDTTWSQQAFIKASSAGNNNDEFGHSVAVSGDGNTIAAGAPKEDSEANTINGDQNNGNAEDEGAVYVFTRTGTTWSQQAYIKPSNGGRPTLFAAVGNMDEFGSAVGLNGNGNTLIVGSPWEDSDDTGVSETGTFTDNILATGGFNSGAVYIFVRDASGTWAEQFFVKATGRGVRTGDQFGFSLSVDDWGNIAVGAYEEDSDDTDTTTGTGGTDANTVNSGAAYYYSP